MKSAVRKKVEELQEQFLNMKEEIEEFLTEEENYIEELQEKGRVSETSENAVACFSSMAESLENIEAKFLSILEF